MSSRFESEQYEDRKIDEQLKQLPKYVTYWNLNLKASRRTAVTRRNYIWKIERFLRTINYNPMKVKPEDINQDNTTEFYISCQRKRENGRDVSTSDSYQLTMWNCLNSFMKFMVDRGYMEKNYMNTISKTRNHDLERINENRLQLTSKDFKKILKAVDNDSDSRWPWTNRDRAILLVFMNTGMRESALKNMELDDLDFEKHTLKVIDKEEKKHVYIMNEVLENALKDWLDDRFVFLQFNKGERHVFVSRERRGMSVNAIADVVKKYSEKGIGKRLSPHKLRAGVATILYHKTGDLETVRRAIGHSNISTTQRYVVTKNEDREKMANIMGNLLA